MLQVQPLLDHKGTVDEIPVGYVALDVQKFSTRQALTTKHGLMGGFNAGGGEHSCVYNGNAYYSAQLAAAGGTVQAGSTGSYPRNRHSI